MKQKIFLLTCMLLCAPRMFANDTVVASGYTIEHIKTPEQVLQFCADLLTDPNFQVNYSFKHLCVNLAPLLLQHPDRRVQELGKVFLKNKSTTRTNVPSLLMALKPHMELIKEYSNGRTLLPVPTLLTRLNDTVCYKGT